VYSLLQKVLNFAVKPRSTPIEDILTGVEKAALSLPVEMTEEARQETVRIIKKTPHGPEITTTEMAALKTLKDNVNLTILPAYKGNATVVLNTSDYKQKISSLLEDSSYRTLTKDPTDAIERKTILLLKKSSVTEETRLHLCPAGSRPPRLYGLPKIHKGSSTETYCEQHWGPHVSILQAPVRNFQPTHRGNQHTQVKTSFHFIGILKSLKIKPHDLIVTFEVVSLFTKVPVEESLRLPRQHFKDEILALYKNVLTSTYFCDDGQFYEQTDVVAMGSPISPAIVNFYMEDFEMKDIETATHKPACWYRYVDDTFVIWPHGKEKLTDFLNHLNGIHNNSPWKR